MELTGLSSEVIFMSHAAPFRTHAGFPGSETHVVTVALTTVDSSTSDLFTLPLQAGYVYVFDIMVVYKGIDVPTTSGFVIRTTSAWRDGTDPADQEVLSSFGRVAGVTGSAQTVSVAVEDNNFRVTVDGRSDTDINWAGTIRYQAISVTT
jgi:hypothetical protein